MKALLDAAGEGARYFAAAAAAVFLFNFSCRKLLLFTRY